MDLKEFLNSKDVFAANAGCRLVDVMQGRAVAEMTVAAAHLNGGGVCQGGALFTLADLAMAAVMNSGGQLTFGIQNSISFLRSAFAGDKLTAEAVEVHNHRKIPFIEVRVSNQHGELVCVVTGMGYRKNTPLPLEG